MSKSITTHETPLARKKPRRQVDELLVREAQDYWIYQVIDPTSPVEVEEAVGVYFTRYKSVWLSDAFDTSGDACQHRAVELLGGTRRLEPNNRAGTLGALAVALGGRLVHTVVHMDDLGLELPGVAVFDPNAADMIFEELRRAVRGPFASWLECGEAFERRLHLHVLHGQDCCFLGWSRPVETGEEIMRTAKYLCKKPRPTRENIEAYAKVVREHGRVARRFRVVGIGRARPTLGAVEETLGLSLRRRLRCRTNIEPVGTQASAQLTGTVEIVKVGGVAYQVAYDDVAELAQKIGTLELSPDPIHQALAAQLALSLPARTQTYAAFKMRELGADPDLIARAVGVPRRILHDGTFTTLKGNEA